MVADIDQPDGAVKEQFVFCVVRGDMELNETKLTNVIKARRLRPATTPEIQAVGAEPGYGSPIGIRREQVLLLVDDLWRALNLVAGANRGYHAQYELWPTTPPTWSIWWRRATATLARSAARRSTTRGVEVGNIFKLGTKYSKAMGATYLMKVTRNPL
jgi:prolyl-tRNA synthetase